ncbi:odorant receptor 43a-like [Diabrotica virgifera virgifera]|uniref:Odorant receptor n=1 Tax=Diabrotica virgifera virgifera TaxID=50390 RepID=A0ABM5JIS0_DIAVI|nr:odorant receptor 43a-like [Diabrotica virgifera virgifera]
MTTTKTVLLDFKKFYLRDMRLLNNLGVYVPVEKKKYPMFFAFYCFMVFFFFMGILNGAQYLYTFINAQSIRDFAGTGYVANICSMANVKAYYIFIQRKQVMQIFDDLNCQRFQPTTEKAKKIAQKGLDFYYKANVFLTAISVVACTFSVTTPIFYPKNGGLPFATWYPFNVSSTPIHQIVYLHQTIAVYYNTLINVSGDLLVAGLSTFIGVQCDLLCYELVEGRSDSLVDYITYHQEIVKLTQKSEQILSRIYFFQFFATTTGLCMTLFLITLVEPNTVEFLFLVIYLAAIFNLLLIPTLFSSELRRKSENIPMAAYSYPWVDAPKSLKRDLIFFIHRTQTPIQFQVVGFFNLSLEVFLKIVQSSFSYYTMLKNLMVQ